MKAIIILNYASEEDIGKKTSIYLKNEENEWVEEVVIKPMPQKKEPILDKIRAEIEDIAFDWQEIDGEHASLMVVGLNDVLQIIDKHKSETEE